MTNEPENDGRAPYGRQPEAAIHTFPGPRPGPERLPQHRPGLSRAYVAAWVLLALGAGLYLAALQYGDFTREEPVATVKQVEAMPNQEIENLTRQLAAARKAQSELDESLATIRADLADLQDRIHGLSLADQIIVARLTAAEKGKPLSREALSALVEKLSQGSPEETSTIAPGAFDAAAVPGLAAEEPASEANKDDAQLADASQLAEAMEAETEKASGEPVKQKVAAVAPAETEAAPKAAAPAKSYGIELAISTSPEALRLNWDLLVERNATVLGGLSPRAAPIEGGENLRLVAGPFASAADAKRACKQLQESNIACRSSDYGGNPL